jgi:hypothetical protein
MGVAELNFWSALVLLGVGWNLSVRRRDDAPYPHL